MTPNPADIRVETASVTDRGLNERRPLNEDSMLSDSEHNVFAVADGVGGAEAGEVASQTAIEVLQKAFSQHVDGDDAEDLMEIAIQRANDNIYRLSREQPQLAMMATTVVALHLDGLRATVGHVGDSRLYRLTPDGTLRRETEDHSVVEEEVRAGRMTPEQAANHPSRNVISRALGAEASVEVDMRSFDFENNTTFLLCSDGITRHITDDELAGLLQSVPDLEEACAEMKRLCFERGAEDNLTAVLVRVGDARARSAAAGDVDEEATIIRERSSFATARTLEEVPVPPSLLQRPFHDASAKAPAPAASAATAGEGAAGTSRDGGATSNVTPAAAKSGGAGRVAGLLFLIAACAALAFYVGMRFERKGAQQLTGATAASPTATASPAEAAESPEERFERQRRLVDLSPGPEAARMSANLSGQPLNSDDPEFLYLYGRAMLLTDRHSDAVMAFEKALQRLNSENMTPHHGQLKIDARLAAIAAHMRSGNADAARRASEELGDVLRPDNANVNMNQQPSPGVTP